MCFESYYCLLQTNECNNPNTNNANKKMYIFFVYSYLLLKKKCQRKHVGCGWLDQMILHFRVILNAMYDKCIWCPKTFFLLCMKIRFFLLPHHLEKVFVSVVCSRYCFNWSFILLLQAVMIPSSSGETTKHFTLVKPRYQAVILPMFDRVR